jgi:hypothetical protein
VVLIRKKQASRTREEGGDDMDAHVALRLDRSPDPGYSVRDAPNQRSEKWGFHIFLILHWFLR